LLGTVGSRFQAVWTRRCGSTAAEHYLRALELGISFLAITPTWLAAFIVASVYGVPALHIAGFVLVAIQILVFVSAELHLHRFHKAAGAYLGVKVGWNDPPSNEEKFDQWCRTNGAKAGGMDRS